MASDEEEDDFALLANDHHHQQQQQQPIAPPLVSHRYGSPTSSNPTAAAPDPQHFRPPPPSPSIHHNNNNNTTAKVEDRSTKRPVGVGNGDELSDDGTSPYSSSSKKARRPNPNPNTAEYRKDREEWSDSAIACLLDAYTDKYMQLNRGNLRGRDWEEVAATVSHSHQNKKSVEQCKNKVDNLKKRYKAERQRITSGTLTSSHWPWFKKMEHIVSSSPSSSSSKPPIPDNDVNVKPPPPASSTAGPGPGPGPITQPNRYMGSTPALSSLPNNMKLKSSNPRWQRVVLKISGSVFAGNGPQSVDPKVAMLIAREISMAVHLGVQVAVVVGGRNFFCGDTWVAATGVDRTTAYQIGMMATVMNAVLLQASLEKIGIQTRVQTAFMMQEIAEPYIRRRAIRHLEKGRVVIFGGVGAGPGNPLFTTDTAAALRASEISANAVLKGTNIDNDYGGQPRGCSTMPYENVSYRESLSRGFSAMDMTAITFCEENNIPVVVFNLLEPGNISRALCGDQVGTLIDRPAGIS